MHHHGYIVMILSPPPSHFRLGIILTCLSTYDRDKGSPLRSLVVLLLPISCFVTLCVILRRAVGKGPSVDRFHHLLFHSNHWEHFPNFLNVLAPFDLHTHQRAIRSLTQLQVSIMLCSDLSYERPVLRVLDLELALRSSLGAG